MAEPTDRVLSEQAQRRLATWPPGIVAGVLVGATALGHWGAGPLAAVLYGLVAAFLATRVRGWLEARARAALGGDPSAALLALTLDLAVGAGAGLVAAPLLGASVLPAVGSGAALAGVWTFLVAHAGGVVDRGVDYLLAGDQSADFAHEPIMADAAGLERAGQVEGAIRKYREIIEARPREPDAYLAAAVLLQRAGRAAEAAELLREARRRARITSGHQLLIGRQLAELAVGPLADPTTAAAELVLLAHRFRGTPAGDAAAADAEALRGAGRQDAAPAQSPPEPGPEGASAPSPAQPRPEAAPALSPTPPRPEAAPAPTPTPPF